MNESVSSFPPVGSPWRPEALPRKNAMTCDVEDYFQVSAFEPAVSRATWPRLECRIPANVDRILQLYEDADVAGTFFILGWVAENCPTVVRRITDAGHEVASHGMAHTRVWNQSADEFHADVARAKMLLEDVSGVEVKGFRAASWSFDTRTPWAYEQLARAGYTYSSSIYPVARDHYGNPDAPQHPFYVDSVGMLEIPASSVRFAGRNWPAAGGGFFRLLPLSISKFLLRNARHSSAIPAMFYYHPWELDPDQPRIDGLDFKTRFRHYVNLQRFEPRLIKLLRAFPWGRMDDIYLGNA